MEQYIYGLGMLMEDLRVDQKGRIFILIEGIEEPLQGDSFNGPGFYKEVALPEEYQTFGNVEIVRKLLEQKAKPKFKCDICEDTGSITKTEWSGTDDSYEVEIKCECQED